MHLWLFWVQHTLENYDNFYIKITCCSSMPCVFENSLTAYLIKNAWIVHFCPTFEFLEYDSCYAENTCLMLFIPMYTLKCWHFVYNKESMHVAVCLQNHFSKIFFFLKKIYYVAVLFQELSSSFSTLLTLTTVWITKNAHMLLYIWRTLLYSVYLCKEFTYASL